MNKSHHKEKLFKLEIRLANDEMHSPVHVAKALEYIAMRLKRGADMGTIKDINGNTVGDFYGDFELDN